MPARVLAWLVAVGLVVGACQPGPSGVPATPRGPSLPPGSAGASTPPSRGAPAGLADDLRDGLQIERVLADLRRLEADAAGGDGTRTAAGAGEKAAIEFVAAELRALGWDVRLEPVSIPYFQQAGPSRLEIVGGEAFEDLADFKAVLLSGSGDVTGSIHSLGFDPAASPGPRTGLGCDAADWTGVPVGAVILVQPGPCFRLDVVVHAQNAGAVAVVTSYPEWQRDQVRRPTLVNPADVRIPVLGTTHAVGLALAGAAQTGRSARVAVDAPVEMRTSTNVLADSPWGDPARVLVVGGHIDSAIDGPGINDNGSGTMTILEIARGLDVLADGGGIPASGAWKVRVAFFTGEEIGLLGSGAHVGSLDTTTLAAVEAYLNFDMLGSGNGVRQVYDGDATSRPLASGTVSGLFEEAFASAGLASQRVDVGGAGDHARFDGAGIPIGGLFSGASELKTAEQAALFGGQAGVANDPCYHLACDTVERLDPLLLEQMARTAAWVVGRLATGGVQLEAN